MMMLHMLHLCKMWCLQMCVHVRGHYQQVAQQGCHQQPYHLQQHQAAMASAAHAHTKHSPSAGSSGSTPHGKQQSSSAITSQPTSKDRSVHSSPVVQTPALNMWCVLQACHDGGAAERAVWPVVPSSMQELRDWLHGMKQLHNTDWPL